MKRLLLAGVAAMAIMAVGSAHAADLGVPYKAPAVAAPVAYNWTGCYLGGGGGYGMWNQDVFLETNPGLVAGPGDATVTFGGRGWFGTAQVGCDYQIPTTVLGYGIVIGAFGDWDFGNIHGELLEPGGTVGTEKLSNSWAAGARIGALITPRFLTYVSGGWTQAHFDQVDFAGGISMAASDYNGWFIGSGYEYGFDMLPGLFWKTEYRYSTYSAADLPFFTTATGVPTGQGFNSEKFVQTIRSELVWRFNWGGPPVAARY